jgi:oligopeptidase B
LGYSSLLSPKQVLDLDLSSGKVTVLKEQLVPGYVKENYRCKRLEATASDGTKIPISMVHHKDYDPSRGPLPTVLYGYGSYGACNDPTFDFKRSTLLDKGIVYAIAHIRGGGEMGRTWYEDEGKYLNKMNTFTDFANCAQFLIDQKMTKSSMLAAIGRSAGGLLMGAMANLYPYLFKAIVADVPFVDVMNSMSDPTIPLTVTEWEEWGNPNSEKYFTYMNSYSPYDNVVNAAYPAMLVTGGLNDPRVAYWEPAKWVAKMRYSKVNVDQTPLLLKTDMSAGHFSASDRYKYIKETAFEYSFIIDNIL